MHRPHLSLLVAMTLGLVRVASAQAPSSATPEPAPAPLTPTASQPASPLADPVATETPAAEFDLSSLGLDPNAAFDDKLNVYGFADFTYTAAWLRDSPIAKDSRGFASGNLNIYVAKNLSRKWRALAEIRFLFAPNGSMKADGTITDTSATDSTNLYRTIEWGGIRIERSYLEYDVHPKLTLRAGHWLSPYGLWNIDHGSPAIISPMRPYIIGEQFIPEHQTGVHAFGTHYLRDYRIGYHATVSNGRSSVEALGDPDGKLAFGGRLELGLAKIALDLGVSAYAGRASGVAKSVVDVPSSYDEVAYAADVVWRHDGLLVQGEVMRRDRRYLPGRRSASVGGFLPDG
ncbi:MAG: hypothetical protein WKG01_42370, partial [Kofleriaceae bacterium]